MKLDTKEFEAKMQKSVDAYRAELATIRAGRANPEVLNKITIDYYGSPTAINAVASVAVSDARTLTDLTEAKLKNMNSVTITVLLTTLTSFAPKMRSVFPTPHSARVKVWAVTVRI